MICVFTVSVHPAFHRRRAAVLIITQRCAAVSVCWQMSFETQVFQWPLLTALPDPPPWNLCMSQYVQRMHHMAGGHTVVVALFVRGVPTFPLIRGCVVQGGRVTMPGSRTPIQSLRPPVPKSPEPLVC